MSSEIEQNEHYVYARPDGLPWHGLGIQESRRMTLEEVIGRLPRMAEVPILCRVFYRDPSIVEKTARECDSKRAIVYPSDGRYIGMATAQYQPRAFADAFRQAFGWVESLGAWVSGAALLRGGSRAFIMARLPDQDFNIGSDAHTLWLSVFAGSDGVTGIYPHATFVREVCANTVGQGLAESKASGRARSIAHHGNVDFKLAEASVALGQLTEVRAQYQRAGETMLAKSMSRMDMIDVIDELVPGESGRASNVREAILRLAHTGKGNRQIDVQGTAYALFQGVTDFTDHEAVRTSKGDVRERRFLYAMEGAGAELKQRALDLLAA